MKQSPFLKRGITDDAAEQKLGPNVVQTSWPNKRTGTTVYSITLRKKSPAPNPPVAGAFRCVRKRVRERQKGVGKSTKERRAVVQPPGSEPKNDPPPTGCYCRRLFDARPAIRDANGETWEGLNEYLRQKHQRERDKRATPKMFRRRNPGGGGNWFQKRTD